jgi:polysaccharide export outer membrane protein
MGSFFSSVRALTLGLLVALSGSAAATAQEAYPIGPGDQLRVSFLANPVFDRVMEVGIDGAINLPLLGELNVGGQTINELRRQIPNLMTGAVYRERVNGEYLLVSIEPEEVLIDVVDYRPVYFDGAVRQPGQQPFEIGMTVRHGLAGAEGLLIEDPRLIAGSELRNHPRVLMADLIGILAEMAVHEAILAGTEELDLSALQELDAPAELTEGAIALARSQVATSGDILFEEVNFLDTAVREAEARVIAALRHEETMTAIAVTEEAEVARVENLVARRIVSSEALTTTRRLYLQAIERLGTAQAERLEAEATRRELVLERNQATRERALNLQARLQALSQEAAQLRVRIDLSTTMPTPLTVEETSETVSSITIFRQFGGQAREIEASMETSLMPGDVVNISLQR